MDSGSPAGCERYGREILPISLKCMASRINAGSRRDDPSSGKFLLELSQRGLNQDETREPGVTAMLAPSSCETAAGVSVTLLACAFP